MGYSEIIRLTIMFLSGIGLFSWVKLIVAIHLINKTLSIWQFITKFISLFCWAFVCLTFIVGQIAYYGVTVRWNVYFMLMASVLIIIAAHNYDRITSMHLRDIIEDNSKSAYKLARRQLEQLQNDTESLLQKNKKRAI